MLNWTTTFKKPFNAINHPLAIPQLMLLPGGVWTLLTLGQWYFSGNPVAIQCAWTVGPSVRWNATGERNVGSQCVSSVFPGVFQWSSRGDSVCSNYANQQWISPGIPLCVSISQCGSCGIPVYPWLQGFVSVFQLCKLTLDCDWKATGG